MDFDRMAIEIFDRAPGAAGTIGIACLEHVIAALRDAYNAGVEDAASLVLQNAVGQRTRKAGAELIQDNRGEQDSTRSAYANAIRKLKVTP